jgi:hypothetical protein
MKRKKEKKKKRKRKREKLFGNAAKATQHAA